MNSHHLSDSPIWIPRTDHILSLDGKTLLLCEQNGQEHHVHLSIQQAQPSGPDCGKIAVRCWQTDHTHVPFEAVPPGLPIPTKKCATWSAYLDQWAVNQVSDAAEYCDFELRLSE